jgi:predicted adenylyl cyclase CyaB
MIFMQRLIEKGIVNLNDLMPTVHYEVERRVNMCLESALPQTSTLKRIYGGTDTYFALDPFLRVRDMTLTHPYSRHIQKVCEKEIVGDGIVKECEADIPDAQALIKFLTEREGTPKVIIDGWRKEYSLRDLTVCVDNVKGLGNWTEIERVTKSKEENSDALREVVEAFKSLGVKENQLTSEIYPTLLFKKKSSV